MAQQRVTFELSTMDNRKDIFCQKLVSAVTLTPRRCLVTDLFTLISAFFSLFYPKADIKNEMLQLEKVLNVILRCIKCFNIHFGENHL